jgi:hypothetical protein
MSLIIRINATHNLDQINKEIRTVSLLCDMSQTSAEDIDGMEELEMFGFFL